MTITEINQIRLHRQHITDKADKLTVVRDLCGLQAQFTVNVYYGLKIRCIEDITPDNFGNGLVKSWTVRGTVHAFSPEDLPLWGNRELYRNCDFKGYGIGNESAYNYCSENGCPEEILAEYRKNGFAYTLSPERQQYWSEFIVKQVDGGICGREELKRACAENGMNSAELDAMFNQWGGCIRELCERGFLCYKVLEKKEFMPCPEFTPKDRDSALLEIASRYLLHFAPATVKDFAYYCGCTQTAARGLMSKLPLKKVSADGAEYYYLGELPHNCVDIPKCVLLAGFDQLMLGYRKDESLFLPRENLRGIFNLAGIVMPSILLNGRVIGRWRKNGKKTTLETFEYVSAADKKAIENTALQLYGDINKIEWKSV